jgi:hypothetical protein
MKRPKNSHPKYTPRISTAKTVFRNNGYNDHSLTFDQWYDMSQQSCFYCGARPSRRANKHFNDKDSSDYARKNGTFIYNGVDCVDNAMGHTQDNCVPCCKTCNFAKNEMSFRAFKAWITKAYKHLTNKK